MKLIEYSQTPEVWKDVEGYEGHYLVSNNGTAKERWASKQRIPVKGVHIETGKEIYLKSMAEGALYGFDQRAISDVCAGKYQTHRGYSFQKIEKEVGYI